MSEYVSVPADALRLVLELAIDIEDRSPREVAALLTLWEAIESPAVAVVRAQIGWEPSEYDGWDDDGWDERPT